jgi:uncharacterized protein (DUF305 family)
MNKQVIIALIAGLVIGGIGTFGIVSANSSNTMMNNEATQNNNSMTDSSGSMDHNAGGSMADMNAALEGKTGDEFDKEFIMQMIEHHQGAIDMAEQAQMNAGRQEIKDLSTEIISAQESEISQMRQWQNDWGFTQ